MIMTMMMIMMMMINIISSSDGGGSGGGGGGGSSSSINEACGFIIIVLNDTCGDLFQCSNNNSRESIDRFQRLKALYNSMKNTQHINTHTKINSIDLY